MRVVNKDIDQPKLIPKFDPGPDPTRAEPTRPDFRLTPYLIITQLKHDRTFSNLKLKLIGIKGTHPKCDQGPQPQSGTSTSS